MKAYNTTSQVFSTTLKGFVAGIVSPVVATLVLAYIPACVHPEKLHSFDVDVLFHLVSGRRLKLL